MSKAHFTNQKICYFVLSLVLLSILTFTNVASAHAATTHAKNPAGCTNTIAYQGNNSIGAYTVYLTVHYVKGFLCNVYLYSTVQAFVEQGNSTNLRICAGEVPENLHRAEVCHDYSGSAPLGGWLSPAFNSYNWTFNGCKGYGDILNHVGISSNNGC